MIIYIDENCKCHTEKTDGMTAVETDFFDGFCHAYIEGYCYVPSGRSCTGPDWRVYNGEMIFPWRPWHELDSAQREYERQQLAAYEQALSEIEAALGVSE